MDCLRNLAQTFHEFATNHVEESDVSDVAVGATLCGVYYAGAFHPLTDEHDSLAVTDS